MIEISEELLKKHSIGLQAARNYYVLNLPTGLLDSEYDALEADAMMDGLSLRDYVRMEIQGTRTENADYITKVEKTQVPGDMYDALMGFLQEHPEVEYIIPKYDGSSLAAYYGPTGECMRVVTVGGSNLGGEGIDQTWKFSRFFPRVSPELGVTALQCECLVSLEHGFGDSSRQKANGLVNSKFLEDEVEKYCNIRCFRYFSSQELPYRETLKELGQTKNLEGDIKFSGGFVLSREDLGEDLRDFLNHDIWKTPTGTFLVDGVVCYDSKGVCVKALKYKDAGRGETTTVRGIKWNNQVSKGKDSWSANALIDPVLVRGSQVTKPTVGSLKGMVQKGLSKGAKVTIILANSTIPAVKDVVSPGDLNYEWPTCSCGYEFSEKDIFGTVLKCGNPGCSERLQRMRDYLSGVPSWEAINYDTLMVIDRWSWAKKRDLKGLSEGALKIIQGDLGIDALEKFMSQGMTPLQLRNLSLVIGPTYKALYEYYVSNQNNSQGI